MKSRPISRRRRSEAFARTLQHHRLGLLARGETEPRSPREEMFVRALWLRQPVHWDDFVISRSLLLLESMLANCDTAVSAE